MPGLASSAFARHYSRNHFCFLFLRVLRCFTSPRSLPHPMYSDTGDTTSLVPGFPIRTSSDQRSVDNSPRHIAASHVLHRLLMPRHTPCALKHLQTQENNSNKNATNQQFCLDARNHYPQIKHHTPPPRWSDTTTRTQRPGTTRCCLRTQQCAWQKRLSYKPHKTIVVAHQTLTHYRREFLTAQARPDASLFSWCSLERR